MALRRPIRAPSIAALSALESALANFRISSPNALHRARVEGGRRLASHQAQGRANGAADGPGKRLGAKKTAGEYVVPGNILYKQRGTLWFPGDGCHMGKDHTIHASVPGYVTYYRDPQVNPKRKYIGIVFERHNTLPQAPNAPRRRQLGMLAYQLPASATVPEESTGDLQSAESEHPSNDAAVPSTIIRAQPQEKRQTRTIVTRRTGADGKVERVETTLTLRPGYQWRQMNHEIGRAAEKSPIARAVRPFKPGDRWEAWRRSAARKAKNAERRALGRGSKGKKKK